jgi:hypothetical protein
MNCLCGIGSAKIANVNLSQIIKITSFCKLPSNVLSGLKSLVYFWGVEKPYSKIR